MKIPNSLADRSTSFDSTMTPMIDVVFLLIIFFVWTAGFQLVEHLLPSHLTATGGSAETASEPPPPPDFDPVVVRIVWLGSRSGWMVNGAAVREFALVRQRLTSLAAIKRDLPVIIDPEGDVPLGDVIDVYDLARLVGFEKIQFAASEEV
jgi:biopolymer transport protein ExbD